jgi:hypothetical protein
MQTLPVAIRHRVLGTLAAAATLAVAGCGGGDTADHRSDLPQGSRPVELDPAEFTTQIDNRWWPMVPGTRWRYRETDQEGAEQHVVVTVTDQTRKIANGITARVVRDTVTEDGEIIEDTFDWYAQDEQGNIWYLGEDTAEFENGDLTTKAGSFEAGVDGAIAGVIMPADPEDGQTYRQEHYKGEAEDRGEVLSTREWAQTPYGHFERALLTKDTNPLEPRVLEYKLYAPDVGPVLALGVSGGPGSREELLELDKAPASWVRKAGTAPLGQGPT